MFFPYMVVLVEDVCLLSTLPFPSLPSGAFSPERAPKYDGTPPEDHSPD